LLVLNIIAIEIGNLLFYRGLNRHNYVTFKPDHLAS